MANLEDFALLEDLSVDYRGVSTGGEFAFSILLDRLAKIDVPFLLSIYPILDDGTLDNGYSLPAFSVPTEEKGETFSQSTIMPNGAALQLGAHLLIASQAEERVVQTALINIIPVQPLAPDRFIATTPVYTPVIGLTVDEDPQDPEFDDSSRYAIAPIVRKGRKYFFTVVTSKINYQNHGQPDNGGRPANTTLVFELEKKGTGSVTYSWTGNKKLRPKKKTTTFSRYATINGLRNGAGLDPGTYELRARRESNEDGEEWVSTTLIVR